MVVRDRQALAGQHIFSNVRLAAALPLLASEDLASRPDGRHVLANRPPAAICTRSAAHAPIPRAVRSAASAACVRAPPPRRRQLHAAGPAQRPPSCGPHPLRLVTGRECPAPGADLRTRTLHPNGDRVFAVQSPRRVVAPAGSATSGRRRCASCLCRDRWNSRSRVPSVRIGERPQRVDAIVNSTASTARRRRQPPARIGSSKTGQAARIDRVEGDVGAVGLVDDSPKRLSFSICARLMRSRSQARDDCRLLAGRLTGGLELGPWAENRRRSGPAPSQLQAPCQIRIRPEQPPAVADLTRPSALPAHRADRPRRSSERVEAIRLSRRRTIISAGDAGRHLTESRSGSGQEPG